MGIKEKQQIGVVGRDSKNVKCLQMRFSEVMYNRTVKSR